MAGADYFCSKPVNCADGYQSYAIQSLGTTFPTFYIFERTSS